MQRLGVSIGVALAICAGTTPMPGQALAHFDEMFADALRWRSLGPNRGGRSITAAGSAARPFEYYFGATGGGLWKTTDGGTTWAPVTDGQIGSSSVGAVAVAPSHPDIVYIGMGEAELRGNAMQGDGVYRSRDAGKTWTHAGLAATQAISRIRVDPSNADVVFVAALGHPYAANEDRGIFRSRDGGRNWQRVLYRNERTGGADLAIDPTNPRVLYASLWEVYRKPWVLWSGGPGSGLFKSVDGGDTWAELTTAPGFPAGVLGKVTIAVSPADPRRVYANVEAKDGGLYRSDNAGASWTRVNAARDLWQRSFYFMRLTADPKDPETIYALNFQLLRSTDGGKTFAPLRASHADHHDLWIDPNNPRRMINANDGGASVSVTGGETWTEQRYPTAQMYRVETTRDYPYHVCGAQQDNTTACVSSHPSYHLRNPQAAPGDWFYEAGGGEDSQIVVDAADPDIFYAGAVNALTRYDRRTGESRDVQPYPRLVMGEPARGMRERWNWVQPVAVSRADPTALYTGSQHLWRTRNRGATWEKISPDLTRADTATMGNSGGPINFDQDGPEIYATLYSIAPSRREAATIWTGSDDGLVHVTRNSGRTWSNVTPAGLPAHSRISLIEASPHDPATAYVAARRHEMDDRAPYLFRTRDYGKSWTKITTGIPGDDYVHAVREDPVRRGLLYAGTEHGVHVSFDDGEHWNSLRLNLPDVEVTSLLVEGRDVVIATHGRSFYVLDDVASLRQWTSAVARAEAFLFQPTHAVRRLYPATIDYYVGRPDSRVRLEILDEGGRVVRSLLNDALTQPGVHRSTWDLRYKGATVFPGIVLEGGDPSRGPWAPPGRYTARIVVNGRASSHQFLLKRDPRLRGATDDDLRAQFNLALRVSEKESEANEAVIQIRSLRRQVNDRLVRARDSIIVAAGNQFVEQLGVVEAEIYQVRNQGPKDKIAFPIKLNDRLTGLRSNLEQGDGAPPVAYSRVFRELSAELASQIERLSALLNGDLARLNRLLIARGLEPVRVEALKM